MKRRFQRFLPVLTALLLMTTAMLSACGAGISKNSEMAMVETAAASGIGAYDSMAAPASMVENLSMEMAEEGLGGTTSITQPQAAGRKLIRNIRLSVETDAFDELLPALEERITALSGYIEQSDISGSSMIRQNMPSRRYASITARIPSTSLEQFITDVESRGNVTYKSETTNDVTLQYSDLESRKKSLTIEQERIWALLEKADTLESVIALEERLSEIRYELESMESQLRLYDNQVDYSTVYMDISEVTVYTPTAPETIGERIQNGFAKNIEWMGNFLTSVLVIFLSASPIWLPVLIIAGLIFWIFRWFKKKKEKAKAPKPAAEAKEKEQEK